MNAVTIRGRGLCPDPYAVAVVAACDLGVRGRVLGLDLLRQAVEGSGVHSRDETDLPLIQVDPHGVGIVGVVPVPPDFNNSEVRRIADLNLDATLSKNPGEGVLPVPRASHGEARSLLRERGHCRTEGDLGRRRRRRGLLEEPQESHRVNVSISPAVSSRVSTRPLVSREKVSA